MKNEEEVVITDPKQALQHELAAMKSAAAKSKGVHIEVKSKEEQEAEAAKTVADAAGDEALAKSLAAADVDEAENPYLYDTRGPKKVVDYSNTNPSNDEFEDYDLAG